MEHHADPKPFSIALCNFEPGLVELMSFPIPRGQQSDVMIDRDWWRNDNSATIMVRTRIGVPGTLKEVPLKDVCCLGDLVGFGGYDAR